MPSEPKSPQRRRPSVPHTSEATYLPYETERVRQELDERGFCVIPQLIPASSIDRARKHLEKETLVKVRSGCLLVCTNVVAHC